MFPVPAKNRLRSISRVRAGQESLAERVREWAGRLVGMKEKRVPVRDLYSGDHWFVARALPALGVEKNFAIQLWGLFRGLRFGSVGESSRSLFGDLHQQQSRFRTAFNPSD